MQIFSVNMSAKKLDFAYRGGEMLTSAGNRTASVTPAKPAWAVHIPTPWKTPPAFNIWSRAWNPHCLRICDRRVSIDKEDRPGLLVELGGGLRRVMRLYVAAGRIRGRISTSAAQNSLRNAPSRPTITATAINTRSTVRPPSHALPMSVKSSSLRTSPKCAVCSCTAVCHSALNRPRHTGRRCAPACPRMARMSWPIPISARPTATVSSLPKPVPPGRR